ncbi:MAG: esterase-like activity of phytase family protein, partial [Bacteroidaceae bacterium]|nr:esterase-like activity of phytase family protein [Bacteroidaceae bacterium]
LRPSLLPMLLLLPALLTATALHAQDSTATRTGLPVQPTLGTILQASQGILLPHSTINDSLLKALPLPTGVRQVASNPLAMQVAMPVLGIVGSTVGLPLAGAVTLATKLSAVTPTIQKINNLVPEESRSYLKEQIGVLRQQLADAGKEDTPRGRSATLLSAADLGQYGLRPGNYSGITPLGGDSFAIVDDKSAAPGFTVLHIRLDSVSGKVVQASCGPFRGQEQPLEQDCEDIAYVAQSHTVFICSEKDQTVREYGMDGLPTGRSLNMPAGFGPEAVRTNAGLESLAYDSAAQRFWTTTEGALKADTPYKDGRRQAMRLIAFDTTLNPVAQHPYLMDAPRLKTKARYYAHGISALLAPGDGTLLVLERELSVPTNFIGAKTSIRIFRIGLDGLATMADGAAMGSVDETAFPQKEEVASFTTNLNLSHMNYGNYEGMCLGPRLQDGRQTLLLIADSQAGAGNSMFRLKDYLKVVVLPAE